MSASQAPLDPLRLGALARNAPRDFTLTPDAALRAALARRIGLDGIRKLRLEGTLEPLGKRDWLLRARLGATVVQPCVVTAAPVTTRIEADVTRSYLADFRPPEEAEAEMPEDDTAEALPDMLDLVEVLAEALALEVPDYPRAPQADLGAAVAAPPGVTPLRDEDTKPFAALQGLRDKLDGGADGPDKDEDPGS